MRNRQITNSNLRHIDWAYNDRAAMLRSLNAARPAVPSVRASSGWGTDVASSDPRSAHASLGRKSNARALWWNTFSWAYIKVVPGADLERAMYAYHRLHHTLTLTRMEFVAAVSETAAHIRQDGVLAAARRSALKQFN